MGTKPEVEVKPKLWLDHKAEAEAVTFWNHEAETEAEALPFGLFLGKMNLIWT